MCHRFFENRRYMEVREFCVSKTVPLTQNLHSIFFASPKIRKTPSFNQILKLQNNKPYSSEFDFGYTVFKLIGKNKNHTTSGLTVFSPIFFCGFLKGSGSIVKAFGSKARNMGKIYCLYVPLVHGADQHKVIYPQYYED